MRRADCHARIKQAERDHDDIISSLRMVAASTAPRAHLPGPGELTPQRLASLVEGIADLYFLRMFAHFESTLRHYWRAKGRATRPSTQALIDALARRVEVPQVTLDAAQMIRAFRNFLVHEEHDIVAPIRIDHAVRVLNTYLARLPLEW